MEGSDLNQQRLSFAYRMVSMNQEQIDRLENKEGTEMLNDPERKKLKKLKRERVKTNQRLDDLLSRSIGSGYEGHQ